MVNEIIIAAAGTCTANASARGSKAGYFFRNTMSALPGQMLITPVFDPV
jgi:hypothetical protein